MDDWDDNETVDDILDRFEKELAAAGQDYESCYDTNEESSMSEQEIALSEGAEIIPDAPESEQTLAVLDSTVMAARYYRAGQPVGWTVSDQHSNVRHYLNCDLETAHARFLAVFSE